MQTHHAGWTTVLVLGLGGGLLNCSSSSGAGGTGASSTSGMTATAVIDTQGGTLTLGSLTLVVPPGDVTGPTTFQVTQTTDPAPAGYVAYSPVYRFAPEGLVFSSPLTVVMPYAGDAARAKLYWSQSTGTGYDALASQVGASTVTAQVSHFSNGFVGAPSLSGAGGAGGAGMGGAGGTSSASTASVASASGGGGAPTATSSSGTGVASTASTAGSTTVAASSSGTGASSTSSSGGATGCGISGGPGQPCSGTGCLYGYSCTAGVCVPGTPGPGCGYPGEACCAPATVANGGCYGGICAGSPSGVPGVAANTCWAGCGGPNQQECLNDSHGGTGTLQCVQGNISVSFGNCLCCGTQGAFCCGGLSCGTGLVCNEAATPTCVQCRNGADCQSGVCNPDNTCLPAGTSGSSSSSSSSSGAGGAAACSSLTGMGGSCAGIDLTSDPLNCGACGHSCEGGACSASTCQPAVLELDVSFPYTVAVDAANVYWTDFYTGSVLSCAIGGCGGVPTVIASGQTNPTYLAVDAHAVYFWADDGGPALLTCPLTGCVGSPTMLATSAGGGMSVASDGTWVYYTSSGSPGGGVFKVSPAGGTPIVLVGNITTAGQMAIDDSAVYWVGGSSMMRVNKDASGLTTLPVSAAQVAVDGNYLYWTDGNYLDVKRSNKDGSGVVTLATSLYQAFDLTSDGCNVYWSLSGAPSPSVVKCAAAGCGGTPTAIATGQGAPQHIAASPTTVAWLDDDATSGAVMALTKSYADCACSGSSSSSSSSASSGGGCGGADLTSDPLNCGACGHSCLGGACSGSVCQPLVLQPHAAFQYVSGVAVDATSVYWLNVGSGGSVVRCAIGGCGGVPTVLAAQQASLGSFALSGTSLYWGSSQADAGNTWTIVHEAVSGGPLTTFLSGSTFASAIAADASNVYWLDGEEGTVAKAPVGGGAFTVLASGRTDPTNIAVDATTVYWTEGAGTGATGDSVMQCAISGCGASPTVVAANQYNARGIAVAGSNVYWTSFSTSGTVMQAPVGGGTPITLAQGMAEPAAVAVDATNVYFTNQSGGTIVKVPIGGGALTVLATGQNQPEAIVVDAAHIYWSNYNDGTVMQLAK